MTRTSAAVSRAATNVGSSAMPPPSRASSASSAKSAHWMSAGGGGNYVWVDREHDLVVVTRWIPDLTGIIDRVMAAVEQPATR